MIDKLLPRIIDNTYRGHKAALWILGLLVLLKSIMGLNSIFNGHGVATGADGIPLDAFTPAGAQTVLAFFAVWGWALFVLSLLGLLALVRYRALVPLAFLVLLVEHAGRKLILVLIPVAHVGSPPASFINVILLGLTVLGLVLSLGSPGRRAEVAS